jgi:hypothetical protein
MSREEGRKVFFLYPPSVIKEETVHELVRNEYEVYLLQNHIQAVKLFQEYKDSVVFINIDHELKELTWEDYIKTIMNHPKTKEVKVGVVSYEGDQKLVEKYLMELEVPCGFVRLSLGGKETLQIVMKVLDAVEAKRRRKFVRVKINENRRATFTIATEEKTYTGRVIDISSYGMSLAFDNERKAVFENKEHLKDIQLRLRGVLCRVSGFVIGRMEGSQMMHIVVFSKETSPASIERIHDFVYRCLQRDMDDKIKSLA